MLQRQSIEPLIMPPNTPFLEEAQALAEACLQFRREERPGILDIQEALVSWLNEEEACSLGFDIAAFKMPRVPWREGAHYLLVDNPAGGADAEGIAELCWPELQVDLEVIVGLPVVAVYPNATTVPELEPVIHSHNFLDWVEEPEALQILVLSMASEVRTGVTCTPWMVDLGRVVFRAQQDSRSVSAILKLLFPDPSGRASIRILAWRLERAGVPQWNLCNFDPL